MVTGMLEQWLFHPASALDGSIVVQLGKIDANTKVCGMVYVVCVYEIWLSVLDGSFVTQLGKIAGYGIWCMEWEVWSMGVWQYEACTFISDPLFLNLVLAHKTFHTAHVWKYKSQCEHNYYTSNYHHT